MVSADNCHPLLRSDAWCRPGAAAWGQPGDAGCHARRRVRPGPQVRPARPPEAVKTDLFVSGIVGCAPFCNTHTIKMEPNKYQYYHEYQVKRYEDLMEQLVAIERERLHTTLPYSDQKLLDEAWDRITQELDELESVLDNVRSEIEYRDVEWRDATEYLEEEERNEAVRAGTVNRIVTFIARSGPAERRVPFLDENGYLRRLKALPPLPPSPRAVDEPRPASPEILMPQEELERFNNMVDDRNCNQCSGCSYCLEMNTYDAANEI